MTILAGDGAIIHRQFSETNVCETVMHSDGSRARYYCTVMDLEHGITAQ